MMKNKIIIPTVIALSLLGTSCNKFLETKPTTQIPTTSAITDYSSASYAIIGAYDGLQNTYYYGRDYLVFGDVYTDNTIISPVNSNRFIAEGQWTVTPNTGDMQTFWQYVYRNIDRVNNIFQAIESGKATMTDTELAFIKGQALAIRGLGHFDLVRFYGQKFVGNGASLGVPYIKAPIIKEMPARNTVSQVYSEAIKDLKEAIALLKVSAPKAPYFINYYGAQALLSRVYLDQLDHDSAKPLLADIIKNGGFALESNDGYISMWGKPYSGSKEFVVAISNMADDYGATSSIGYMYIENGYGDLRVPNEVMSLFSDTDVRKQLYVKGTKDATWNFVMKYPNRDGGNGLSDSPIMRISDVYLMYAECCAFTGDETNAVKYLDMIRQRADPTVGATTSTGEALKNAIALERRKELLYEGQYLFDLKRFGKDINSSYKTPGVYYKTIKYPDTKLAMPIPQKEVDSNPNMVQNPGY